MALAAAAIKAHFKGGAGDAGPGAASEKAQRIFRESRAQAGLDDLEQPATTSQRPAASRQSLDRQLSGVDAVLMMQKAAPAAERGTEPSAKMGMKEKQALLNAMFTARNSVVRAPEADEGSDLGDEDDNDDDSLSDVSERSEAGQAEGGTSVAEVEELQAAVALQEEEEEEDSGIPSVPDQRILAIVNTFVVNTSKLVNRVCVLSEKQLAGIDRGIHKLQNTLTLLEKKLKSVDGLEPGQTPSGAPQAAETAQPGGAYGDENQQQQGAAAEGPSQGAGEAEGTREEDTVAAAGNLVKASEHPVYARFFKMIRMGVVDLAVKQKMTSEGLDPSVIDLGPEAMLEP
ncbi:subunit CCDC53 of WASH complex [Chloropicon roscoffensis]|uniref:Subunit CCDC53 of WASH complex n=1 Tax=Chloropicon roscoffensis TaxID=1461544 RepID=A0AAX4PKF0_9CHLO